MYVQTAATSINIQCQGVKERQHPRQPLLTLYSGSPVIRETNFSTYLSSQHRCQFVFLAF